MADERLPIRPSRLLTIATALATKLGVSGIATAGTLAAEATAWVDAAAKDLKAAGKNGVVTVGTQASPEVLAVGFAMLAAMRTGAVLVPINWRQKQREIAYILADSGAQLVVTDDPSTPSQL